MIVVVKWHWSGIIHSFQRLDDLTNAKTFYAPRHRNKFENLVAKRWKRSRKKSLLQFIVSRKTSGLVRELEEISSEETNTKTLFSGIEYKSNALFLWQWGWELMYRSLSRLENIWVWLLWKGGPSWVTFKGLIWTWYVVHVLHYCKQLRQGNSFCYCTIFLAHFTHLCLATETCSVYRR